MLLLAFVGLAVVTVPLFRGRLAALAEIRFRSGWLLAVSIGIQVLIISVAPGPRTPLREVAYVGSYVVATAFLWVNRRVSGLWLVGVGAALNLLVIAVNGGVMPAAAHALVRAGLPVALPRFFTNSILVANPRLAFLGDIFAIPASWPLSNVFSAGDVCIALGAALTIHRATGSQLTPSAAGQFSQTLRQPSFRRLWMAQGVSNLGDWVYALAVAATLSTRAGGADLARTLSVLLVCQVAPAAAVGAFVSGPLADRHSRRRLMILADVARATAVVTLLLTPEPSPAHFYVVAGCLGLFGAVFQPSLYASIPNVVDGERLVAANALVGATYHIAVMVGPALGAFLVSSIGSRSVFGLNAVSFIVSALLIMRSRIPATERKGETTSPRRDLVDGLRYVVTTPLVRGVLLVMGVVLMAAATKTPLETLFVRDVLTRGASFATRARVLAMVTTAWGLGMLLGSVASPALTRRWHRERLITISVAIVGLCVLAVSRTTDFSAVLLAWIVAGAGNSIGNISYESLLQERTPDALRGRVFAATETVLDGSYLAGAFLAGVLGSYLRVSGALGVSGSILLVAAALSLVVIPVPLRRKSIGSADGPVQESSHG